MGHFARLYDAMQRGWKLMTNGGFMARIDTIEGRGELFGLRELESLFADIRGELIGVLRRRTGNVDTAADLAHDLFLKLPSVRAAIPSREHGRAYLKRMADNLGIDHIRMEGRRAEILDGNRVLFENFDAGPEAAAVTRNQLQLVESALADLPEKCRRVLMLARVEGFSHREIADQLHISVSLVEKYQLSALRHCRVTLGEKFFDRGIG